MTSDTSSTSAGEDPPSGTDPPAHWLQDAARRVRDATAGTRGLTLLLLADLVTVLGAGAVWLALGGDPTVVGVTAGALLAFAAAMLPLIERRAPGRAPHQWPPFVLVVIPLAVLTVGLPALAAWAYWDSRPVNVTHDVDLDFTPPLTDGDTAVATVHAGDPKPRLAITFDVAPHDPAAPVCVPGSELTVRLKGGAGRNRIQSGAPGTEFTFDLGRGTTDAELSVRLRAEQGCELNLSVASAHLDD
ncbi:hypothetical protein ACF1AE_04855 [Streptomyces sp. NPDC014986]|uniref:hypothetical protein n=1 Tax=Streptomyces sp. NPDC014986 TaxID=3364934 RepID=UPI0036F7CC56